MRPPLFFLNIRRTKCELLGILIPSSSHDSLPEYERFHVAVGMGVLDVQNTGYADVFARADKQMYIDKQKAKQQHTK